MWDLQREIERTHQDAREDIIDLKAQIASMSATITGQLERFLLKDVYEAQSTALRERVARLEEEAKAAKAAVRAAVYAAMASVVASIIAGIIMASIARGK